MFNKYWLVNELYPLATAFVVESGMLELKVTKYACQFRYTRPSVHRQVTPREQMNIL
jgi:hypothetical protein